MAQHTMAGFQTCMPPRWPKRMMSGRLMPVTCAPGRVDRGPDAIERLAPAHGSPAVLAAPAVSYERPGEPPPVVRDLHGGAAADAEEAAAVGVVGIARDAEHAPVVRYVDEHPAAGGMAS